MKLDVISLILVVFVGWLFSTDCSGQIPTKAELRSKVQESRKDLTERGFHVRYRVEQEVMPWHVDKDNPVVGPSLSEWFSEHAYIDSENKRYHFTYLKRPEEGEPMVFKFSNGEVWFEVQEDVASLFRGTIAKQRPLNPQDSLYLEMLGFDSGKTKGVRMSGHVDKVFDVLDVLNDDSCLVSVKDSSPNLIFVERGKLDRIVLDSSKSFAVVKRAREFPDGGMKLEFVCEDFEHVDGRVWMPKTCRLKYYRPLGKDRAGELTADVKLVVEEVSLAPPPSLFELPKDRGIKSLFDVENDNFLNAKALKDSELESFLQHVDDNSGGSRGYLFVLLSVAIVFLLGFLTYHKKN